MDILKRIELYEKKINPAGQGYKTISYEANELESWKADATAAGYGPYEDPRSPGIWRVKKSINVNNEPMDKLCMFANNSGGRLDVLDSVVAQLNQ